MKEALKEIQSICEGIEYNRDVPEEAKQIAKENGIIIIVGGADDLMYCYGAQCYLTDMQEHSKGWDGETFIGIEEHELENEASQLGLKIWWCGEISEAGLKIPGYSTEENGAFSYSVKEGIEFKEFKVMEDERVYCTGIIIQLPNNFKPSTND